MIMLKTKTIKIYKAMPSMWYNDKIGKTLKVKHNEDNSFYELPNSNKIVFTCDAIEI